MATEFQYDVFLSFNSADKPRVRRLAERLRTANPRQIKFGFRISNFGFPPKAALSPSALGSDWVGLACPAEASERRRKRSTGGRGNLPFRDPSNAGRRFIPLLLADCPSPSPSGAVPSSPRLAPRAYLGSTMRTRNNPKGVAAFGKGTLTQPRWGCGCVSRPFPRVACSSQPWALRRSAVGAGQTRTPNEP